MEAYSFGYGAGLADGRRAADRWSRAALVFIATTALLAGALIVCLLDR